MRQIKFRGRDAYGQYRYGDLWQRNDGTLIYDEVWHRVKRDSVAQFVGVDSDGREVYEGDVLIDLSGEAWTAALGSYARNEFGLATYNFEKLTLKEAAA